MHAIPATSSSKPAHEGATLRRRWSVSSSSMRATSPLNVCSLRRAHVLVWKGRPRCSRATASAALVVLDLHAASRDPARDVRARSTRRDEADLAARAVRPRRKCVYCGSRAPAHARPRRPALARRNLGLGERRHLVRAVQSPQGDRLLEETSMTLRTPPRPPTPVLFIRLAADHVPDTWRQYLPGLDPAAAAALALATAPSRGPRPPAPRVSATDERPRSRSARRRCARSRGPGWR